MTTVERVQNYLNYAQKINVHQTPKKGLNSGAHGRAFEQVMKVTLNNLRFKGVSGAGRHDTIKKLDGKRITFEIKSGAGELAILDKNGNIKSTCLKSDMIIYAPFYDPTQEVYKQAYVLTSENFFQAIEKAGLVRTKKSSSMYKQSVEEQYNDRLAIQTFTHSPEAQGRLWNILDDMGTLLKDWLIENGLYNQADNEVTV